MLFPLYGGKGPVIVGNIYDQIRSFSHESPHKVGEHVLETDGSGEPELRMLEYGLFCPGFPEMHIEGL